MVYPLLTAVGFRLAMAGLYRFSRKTSKTPLGAFLFGVGYSSGAWSGGLPWQKPWSYRGRPQFVRRLY